MMRHIVEKAAVIAGIYAGPSLVYVLSISILQLSVSCGSDLYSYYHQEIIRSSENGGLFSSGAYGGFYFTSTLVFIYVACILGFAYSLLIIKKELQGANFAVFTSIAAFFSLAGMAALILLPRFTDLCVVELYFWIPLNLISALQGFAIGEDGLFQRVFLIWAFLIGVCISNLAWWFVAAAGAVTLVTPESANAERAAYGLPSDCPE